MKTKTLFGILLCGACLPMAARAAKPVPAVFTVAANGSDHNPGTVKAPFASLERARDAVRALKQAGKLRNGAVVQVRQGRYYLPQTFTLGADDSGTAAHPIVYRAYPGEHPVLCGGRALTGFRPWRGAIQQCDVNAQGLAGIAFRQLFCNGERQTMARYPNADPSAPNTHGWLYTGAVAEKGSKSKFLAAPGDLKPWQDLSQAEVFFFHKYNYYNTIVPVTAADPATRLVTLGQDTYDEIAGDGAERYYFQNILEALDAPGEWYLDRKSGTLYFWPPTPLEKARVEAPLLDTVVQIGPGAEYITVRGFRVEISEGTAIRVSDARHCLVAGNTVAHCGIGRQIGGWATWEDCCGIGIFGGAANGAVGNDVYDAGGHGVKLSGGDRDTLTAAGNYAENNVIHHTGVYWKQGCGARLEGVGNRFSRNLVYDCPRMAVIFGGNNQIIEYNHLHHTNLETCDTGAIYTGGRDWLTPRGSVVRYNYIHDIGGFGRRGKEWISPEFSWGIYLDDNTSGVDVIGNVVVGAFRGGVHLHNARDCRIENNILVDSVHQQIEFNGWFPGHPYLIGNMPQMMKNYQKYSQIPAWAKFRGFLGNPPDTATPMANNTVRRNIFCYSGADAALFKHSHLPLDKSVFDYNLVWHGGKPVSLGMQQAFQLKVDGSPELLKNGGFETGVPGKTPSGWSWYIRPSEQALAEWREGDAHTGKGALRVTAATSADPQKQVTMLKSEELPVQPGHAYQIAAWIRADRPGLTANLVAQSYRAGVHHWAMEQNFPVSTEWKQYVLNIKIPGEKDPGYIPTLDHLYIRLDFRVPAGIYWLDDLSFKEGEVMQSESEWSIWQRQGMDQHSLIAAPGFIAPKRGDYRLRPDSPALKLGFQQIPFAKIGPYPDPLRASWPLSSDANGLAH